MTDLFGPFPSLEVQKFRHVLRVKDRVRVKPVGHVGEITGYGNGKFYVELDSDKTHVVTCGVDELEPETFTHEPMASEKVARRSNDPFGRLEKAAPISAALEESMSPLFENAAGLRMALAAGRVTPQDRSLVKTCMDRLTRASGATYTDPFGNGDDPNARTLRVLVEKYSHGVDGNDEILTKRKCSPDTDPEFSVGQTVKCKLTKRTAKITRLDYGFANLDFGDGVTGIQTCGYLEAA